MINFVCYFHLKGLGNSLPIYTLLYTHDYHLQPPAISSPPKPEPQNEPVPQEKLPLQTGEMVALSVPRVQSRLRSQPLAESLPQTMEQLQMMEQPLDPIEYHLGGLIMMKYYVLF